MAPTIIPKGYFCDSECPQRKDPHRKGLGRCWITGLDVRAEPDPKDPNPLNRPLPEADPCTVLCIQRAAVEPWKAPRGPVCGICGSQAYPLPDRDVYGCPHCHAEAAGVQVRHGTGEVQWVKLCTCGWPQKPGPTPDTYRCDNPACRNVTVPVSVSTLTAALRFPDMTPWVRMMVEWIQDHPTRRGRKVKYVGRDTGLNDGHLLVKYSGFRQHEGDGFGFWYPLAHPSPDELDRACKALADEMERREMFSRGDDD